MPTIYIDHQPYEVRNGLSLLQALLELGFNLPYFCWHPAMGSVGACRQCAIKQYRDANDTRGRIVMACMTPAANNTYISVFDPEAIDFRASITEWLMVNHPHDCPVCDEGGECHLQDMTIMTGHNYRRYRGKKRTFRNQNLGPFVNQEMNRCIQCYRCVRFYRDYAGAFDFNAFSLHDAVFFGRAEDGVLESEFSGNLVEVCPTGVFTDKTLKRHYTRKWDLQTAPSICVNCSVGCNTIPGERYNQLRRIRNRYNGDVNGYFLCDRGRYGYEFVNSPDRIREPRMANALAPMTREAALEAIGSQLSSGGSVIGIGSPRASLESNFALRALVGPQNFYQGVSAQEHGLVNEIIQILQNGPARSPSLQEIAACDAVLLLGEDVSNTAPMMALSLKQSVRQQPMQRVTKTLKIPPWDDLPMREAIQNEHGPLFIATPAKTRIDDIAVAVYRGTPQDIALLGFAVAHELDNAAPPVEGLAPETRDLAQKIATALRAAERPLVLSGSSLGSLEVIRAAASAAWALSSAGKPARLGYALAESNSMGLGLMGGRSLDEALQAGPVDTLIILENDLYRRMPAEQVDRLLSAASHVVALDALVTPTTAKAHYVLPAATFAESDGSLVNQEGRVQRYYQVFVPEGVIQAGWQWMRDLLAAANRAAEAPWAIIDDLQAAMAEALPVFAPLLEVAPPASFRIAGAKIPRAPARWSGRTAIYANRNVREPAPPPDPNTPFAFSMEGATLQPPPSLVSHFWAPGWNSIQALNKFQEEIAGALIGGNPGRRLIEPSSAAPGAQPGREVVSGKPFEATPEVVGPGVTPPDGSPITHPPMQPASPQSAISLPHTGVNPANIPPFIQKPAQPSAPQAPAQPGAPAGQAPTSQPPQTGPTAEAGSAATQPSGAPRQPDYFSQTPAAFTPPEGEWLVVPLYHVFGSEELSLLSPGIAGLTPPPYLLISAADAAIMMNLSQGGGQPGDQLDVENLNLGLYQLTLSGHVYRLPARISKDLPQGVVGLPVLPGLAAIALPTVGKLAPAVEGGQGQEGSSPA